MMNTAASTSFRTPSQHIWKRKGISPDEIKARNNKIVSMRESGVKIADIANETGLCDASVIRIIKNYKETCAANAQSIPESMPENKAYRLNGEARAKRNAAIIEMRKSGMKVREIAEKFGISKVYTQKILNKYDAHKPVKQRENFKTEAAVKREERDAQMMALRMEGLSNEEIAKRMGCCKSTVLRAISYQPSEMTMANIALGHKIRRLKEQCREEVVESMKAKKNRETSQQEISSEVIDNLVEIVAEKLVTRILNALKSAA